MSIDRRKFLQVVGTSPTAMGFDPGVFAHIDELVTFLGSSCQQANEENLSEELKDLIEDNIGRIPPISPFEDAHRGKTSYGELSHGRKEIEGIPEVWVGIDARVYEDDAIVKPNEKYIVDRIDLSGNSPLYTVVTIFRTANPLLVLYSSGGPSSREIYLDRGLKGSPDNAYIGHWSGNDASPELRDTIPNSMLLDVDTMKPEQANLYNQNFAVNMRNVIGSIREYLKLPTRTMK